MRFLMRALSGGAIFAACIVILMIGARPYLGCAPALSAIPGAACVLDEKPRGRRRGGAERSFVVTAERMTAGVETPVIRAFGEVRSGRTLEIHALAAGRLVEVAESFEEGGRVAEGETLFRIDPVEPEWRRAEAEALLGEARSELAAAKSAETLDAGELARAKQQRDLRAKALERQRALAERGVISDATLEEAELALSDAERAAIAAENALRTARQRSETADLSVKRARIALADAERTVEDTLFQAPFAGLLQDVDVTLGRLVSANEQLGALIDPTEMEVGFRLSDADFARLLDETGALASRSLAATLDLGDRAVRVDGVIDRVASSVALAEGGRLVFAKLELPAESVLRPGDFVTVEIAEPPLERVVRLPAGALDGAGKVLVLTEEERLEERAVTVVRRQGAAVLARGDLDGALVVTERTPQLGPGVKARLAEPAGAEGGLSADAAPESASETIALDPERRDRLIAFVRDAGRMSEPRRQKLLAMLNEAEAPRETVERLEARMAGGRRAGSN